MTLRVKKFTYLSLMAAGVLLAALPARLSAAVPTVLEIQLEDDSINPVTAEYITRGIERAELEKAEALILKLDTPGGLLNSTRTIVKHILASDVPVIVYIAPSGARAGSAGVFITYASHVAAMAPSTNIGAAHPVNMGGGKGKEKDLWDGIGDLIDRAKAKKETKDGANGEDKAEAKKTESKNLEEKKVSGEKTESGEDELKPDTDPMSSKILQDTVAFIKSLARKRGRNVEWAVKSVTKSSSITADEALEVGAIDLIAVNETDLLDKIDGRVVDVNGTERALRTKGAVIERVGMDARQKFFNILADPNIAYILMILGFYGLMYEITHPGIGVPGVLGTIFLILAFFSMQTLPTNYAGVALVVLALLLFIAEAYVPGIGLLTLGGVVCMVLGSMLLFSSSDDPMMRVSMSLVLSFTLTTAAITIFLVRLAILAHSRKAVSGQEGLIGSRAEARTALVPGKEGKVFVHGELWNAESGEKISKGEKVIVTAIDGLTLTVEKIKTEE